MAEKRNAECGDLCFDSESGLWHYSAFQRRASHCPSGNTAVLCGAGALAQAAQRLWGLLGALPKPPARGAGPCSGWLCWGSAGAEGPQGASNLSHAVTVRLPFSVLMSSVSVM